MTSRSPTKVMCGTAHPQESLTRSTLTRTMARALGCGGSFAASSGHSAALGTTTRPRPCRRTIFGGPSKAQNMSTMRPFSLRCAAVSAPLPVKST
jgi:hypothetical protein